jgi:hypothetical protein
VARTALPEPIDHKYTFPQFMLALAAKRGRTYGWKTDYAQATRDTPGCQVVGADDIQRWQRERHVPDWAYQQIEILDYRDRKGQSAPEWKSDEVQYLIDLYQADPHESNASLAAKCQEHFDRPVNVPAIKGMVHRLGEQDRLPRHRPPR